MMKTFNDLKYKYSALNALEKIIAINAVLFIITLLLGVAKLTFIKDWFALPADFFDFLLQPWSIVTYGFLHAGLFHVLFNMLMLFYFGRILLNLLSEKIVLSVFFMGIITGGLAFLTFYNLAPESILVKTSSVVGASAGVSALLMFICIYLPYTQIRIFTFNVKLWNCWPIRKIFYSLPQLFVYQNIVIFKFFNNVVLWWKRTSFNIINKFIRIVLSLYIHE